MKVKTVIYLNNMPFDRWDGERHVHATGRALELADGSVVTEYEDEIDIYDDSEAVEAWEDDFYA